MLGHLSARCSAARFSCARHRIGTFNERARAFRAALVAGTSPLGAAYQPKIIHAHKPKMLRQVRRLRNVRDGRTGCTVQAEVMRGQNRRRACKLGLLCVAEVSADHQPPDGQAGFRSNPTRRNLFGGHFEREKETSTGFRGPFRDF